MKCRHKDGVTRRWSLHSNRSGIAVFEDIPNSYPKLIETVAKEVNLDTIRGHAKVKEIIRVYHEEIRKKLVIGRRVPLPGLGVLLPFYRVSSDKEGKVGQGKWCVWFRSDRVTEWAMRGLSPLVKKECLWDKMIRMLRKSNRRLWVLRDAPPS